MKLTKKILVASMAAILAATLIGCGKKPGSKPGKEPTPTPTVPSGDLDKLTKLGPNLVDDGDADESEGEILKFSNNNVAMDKVEGAGVTGNAWKITQQGDWSELVVDLTEFYGYGKSYLISAKIKNDPDADAKWKDTSFTAAWCLYSGDVKNWADRTEGCEYYDFEDGALNEKGEKIVSPWGGDKDVTGAAYGADYTEDTLNMVDALDDDWQEIKYIINASEIQRIVNNSGVYKMEIEFYAGKDGEAGPSYLIDDICIQDMNADLKVEGRTWVDPNPEPEPEPEPEEPEEEE